MKRIAPALFLLTVLLGTTGCTPVTAVVFGVGSVVTLGVVEAKADRPKTFAHESPVWRAIPLREGLDTHQAWISVVDALAARQGITTMDENTGYILTEWKSFRI